VIEIDLEPGVNQDHGFSLNMLPFFPSIGNERIGIGAVRNDNMTLGVSYRKLIILHGE
jgi:hypothetical protein